eukprot:348563-Alexandrium_andersonii.AAC.1
MGGCPSLSLPECPATSSRRVVAPDSDRACGSVCVATRCVCIRCCPPVCLRGGASEQGSRFVPPSRPLSEPPWTRFLSWRTCGLP